MCGYPLLSGAIRRSPKISYTKVLDIMVYVNYKSGYVSEVNIYSSKQELEDRKSGYYREMAVVERLS